jgi:hypothetical protein
MLAAERDHHVAALNAELEQALAHFREHGEALALLAWRHHHIAKEQPAKARLQPRKIECRHVGVAHHG